MKSPITMAFGFLCLELAGCSDKEMQATQKTLEVAHFILSLPAKTHNEPRDDSVLNECNRAGSHTERLAIELEILKLEKEIQFLRSMR